MKKEEIKKIVEKALIKQKREIMKEIDRREARKLATEKLTKMLEPILGFREVTKKEKPEIY